VLEDNLEDTLEFSFYHCYFCSFFTKFKHVTSTYYHSWYLVFDFTFDVTYFHRVIYIQCMRSYLVYQTLNILLSVVLLEGPVSGCCLACGCPLCGCKPFYLFQKEITVKITDQKSHHHQCSFPSNFLRLSSPKG
jgi:hypothetical protein